MARIAPSREAQSEHPQHDRASTGCDRNAHSDGRGQVGHDRRDDPPARAVGVVESSNRHRQSRQHDRKREQRRQHARPVVHHGDRGVADRHVGLGPADLEAERAVRRAEEHLHDDQEQVPPPELRSLSSAPEVAHSA